MADMQYSGGPEGDIPPIIPSIRRDLQRRLIDLGIVSNRRQAEYVLIGVAILCILLAYVIVRWTGVL